MSRRKKNEEVEQLLQSAQDEVLLKLSVNSHIAHISSNYLDSDLDRRFQALKSRPSLPQSSASSQSNRRVDNVTVNVDDELKNVLGDDLSSRFAALKASSSSSSSSSNNDDKKVNGLPVGPDISFGDDNDEEDEVEKLIRWAKDAARLDPSPPSEDEKDSDCDDSDDDYKDSDDDDDPRRKKGHT